MAAKKKAPEQIKFKRRQRNSAKRDKKLPTVGFTQAEAAGLATAISQGSMLSEGESSLSAQVGSHVTNGVRRYVVHVTDTFHIESPYTLSS